MLFKPVKFLAILDNILLLIRKNSDQILTKISKNLAVDIKNERIFSNGNEIFLSPKFHKLIILLTKNLNKLTTFEMIENALYSGALVKKSTISNLVIKVKASFDLEIKNIYSKGYILKNF